MVDINSLFSYKWDAESFTLSEVDFEAEKAACTSTGVTSTQQPSYRQCYVCNINTRAEVMRYCNKLVSGALEISGVGYHMNDFVYVKSGQAPGLLAVAQITDLLQFSGKDDLQVSMFSRSSHESGGSESPQAQVSQCKSFSYKLLFSFQSACFHRVDRLKRYPLSAWMVNVLFSKNPR